MTLTLSGSAHAHSIPEAWEDFPITMYTCSKLFSDLVGNFRTSGYFLSTNWSYRISPVQRDGTYVSARVHDYQSGVLDIQVLRTEEGKRGGRRQAEGSPLDAVGDLVAAEGRRRFLRAMYESLDFTLDHYAARRKHWPPSFRDKLRKIAEEYAGQSTYITFRNTHHLEGRPPEILATLRLITPKDGKLPMEDYLGVKLPASDGILKVEPGNFAVNKDINAEAIGEMMLHLLHETEHWVTGRGGKPRLFTYADRQSRLIYQQFGFKPVPGLQPVFKDGVRWTVLEATPEDLRQVLNRLPERKIAEPRPPKKAALRSRDAGLREMEYNPWAKETVVVRGFEDSRKARKPTEAFFSLWKVKENSEENRLRLSIQSDEDSHLGFRLHLPEKLPLADGFEHRDRAGYRITYRGGQLEASNAYDSAQGQKIEERIRIRISGDLQEIESFEYEKRWDGQVVKSFSGEF